MSPSAGLLPFTLDLPNMDPDITYCVDVVNSTSSATLHSQCGITETEFIYSNIPFACYLVLLFTVTPVNVVGNGTNQTVSYEVDNSKL